MSIQCPKCGKDDCVQKVSAIVSNGTSTSSYQVPVSVQTENGPIYGNLNKQAESTTSLAKNLSAPDKPTGLGCGEWFVIILVLVGLPLACPATLNDWTDGKFPTFMVILGVVIFIGLLIGLIKLLKRGNENTKLKTELWERQMANWNKVYYCHRDDIVFYPNDPDYVTAERSSFIALLSKK